MHIIKGGKMRTTLDLPEKLINEAMKLSHVKTKTAVITKALKELIRKEKISDIKDFKGKIDLNIDLDALRDRK